MIDCEYQFYFKKEIRSKAEFKPDFHVTKKNLQGEYP